jgi:hypothetical protein
MDRVESRGCTIKNNHGTVPGGGTIMGRCTTLVFGVSCFEYVEHFMAQKEPYKYRTKQNTE